MNKVNYNKCYDKVSNGLISNFEYSNYVQKLNSKKFNIDYI
jgi:hypothetical protein